MLQWNGSIFQKKEKKPSSRSKSSERIIPSVLANNWSIIDDFSPNTYILYTDFVKFPCHICPMVQFVSGDDKQPMDKSSRYTIFAHVAEIRDAIPWFTCREESDRSILRPRLSIERGETWQARSGGPRDSCKRCNTCRTRKPFIAVLSLRARKSRFVTPMIAPALYATPATHPATLDARYY